VYAYPTERDNIHNISLTKWICSASRVWPNCETYECQIQTEYVLFCQSDLQKYMAPEKAIISCTHFKLVMLHETCLYSKDHDR